MELMSCRWLSDRLGTAYSYLGWTVHWAHWQMQRQESKVTGLGALRQCLAMAYNDLINTHFSGEQITLNFLFLYSIFLRKKPLISKLWSGVNLKTAPFRAWPRIRRVTCLQLHLPQGLAESWRAFWIIRKEWVLLHLALSVFNYLLIPCKTSWENLSKPCSLECSSYTVAPPSQHFA